MPAPKLPTVFKQNKSRGFQFKPRHYDEQEERLKKLKAHYKKEAAETTEEKASRLEVEERFRSEWQNKRQGTVRTSNRILMLIISGLLALTYFIIKY